MSANKLTMPLWKAIPGLPGYEASDAGDIRSVDRLAADGSARKGVVLKQAVMKNGYHIFGTTGKTHLVSRAVLLAFTDDSGEGLYACHRSGDKSDNSLKNLRWDTPKGNQSDRVLHGTTQRGELHHNAKLSNASVEKILKDTRMHREIAETYGVSVSHISSIKCGSFRRYG